MKFSEARNRFGISHREWMLGNSVTDEEWRAVYQPKGLLLRDHPLPERAERPGPRPLEEHQ